MPTKDAELVAAAVSTGEPEAGLVHHLSDLTQTERERRYGTVHLDLPAPITAGDTATISCRFTIGETDLPTGARLRVAWRWPFDWADPQTDDANAPNHLRVQTSADVRLGVQYERRGDLNPWHHDIDIQIVEGNLHRGNTVDLTVHNWQAPTFATQDGYFLFLINPDNAHRWIRLVDPPRFAIRPSQPHRLIILSPGDGVVGETATVRVRAVDAWENAAKIPTPVLEGSDVEIGTAIRNARYPVWEFPVRWRKPGVHRLQASSQDLHAEGNPTRVHAEPPTHRIFWGDLHGGQSEIGCGAGTLDHHYAYARHVAGLQFTSQQANDHYITRDIWGHVRKVTPQHNIEGEFLAFLGCEWSPPTEDGGDRNVLYKNDEPRMRRSGRFFTESDPDTEPDLPHAVEFLDTFKREPVLLNLHVGGRPTNLAFHAPEIEPLFEIHSTHATSEWFIFDAIQRGYKIGITAGTDGVMGRPGACGPGRRVTRNVRNGLTAIRAEALTQEAIWQSCFNRHTYATTGARILLHVDVNGQPMGSAVQVFSPPEIHIQIDGTAPIERVDLLRGVEVIHTWQIAQPDPNRLRVLWGGAKMRGTAGDQRLFWDGDLSIENGRMSDIQPVALQCPLDRITLENDMHITWHSATAGNDMGFTCRVDGPADAVLKFTTEPCAFTRTLAEIRPAPITLEAGDLNRRVEIGPAPSENGSRSIDLTYTDPEPLSGEHPYWVRVVQTDRHRAWSSPIYTACVSST